MVDTNTSRKSESEEQMFQSFRDPYGVFDSPLESDTDSIGVESLGDLIGVAVLGNVLGSILNSSIEDEIARESTRLHALLTNTLYTGPVKMRGTTANGDPFLLIEQEDGAYRMYAVTEVDDPVLEGATGVIEIENGFVLMQVRPCRNCTGHYLPSHDDHDSEKNFSAMIAEMEAFNGFPNLDDIDGLDDLS